MQRDHTKPYTIVGGVQYYTDPYGSIFCEPLEQDNKVGGTDNNDRQSQNKWRTTLAEGRCLDYGCGNGQLVDTLRGAGFDTSGFDPYNPEFGVDVEGKFDTIFMVETLEHTAAPYDEIDEIRGLLVPNGKVVIETSFSDWVDMDHPYLNPAIGHSTIFSHFGLDCLMASKGFECGPHINQNVRVYRKF
jgi:SAM-dependent methyltransferase